MKFITGLVVAALLFITPAVASEPKQVPPVREELQKCMSLDEFNHTFMSTGRWRLVQRLVTDISDDGFPLKAIEIIISRNKDMMIVDGEMLDRETQTVQMCILKVINVKMIHRP